MRSTSFAALLVGALATWAPAAHAAPFTNGSLESTATGLIQTVPAFSTANGWSTGSVNVEFVRTGYTNGSDTVGAAKDGFWLVDLNGTQGAGSISQTFDTIAGQWYQVDYWMSGNAGPRGTTMADGSKSLVAKWNNVTADSATFVHQPGDSWSNVRWEVHSFLVQAIGATSTLSFHSTSTAYAAAGPVIDHISVTAVPEPSTVGLMLAGFGLVACAVRRRS